MRSANAAFSRFTSEYNRIQRVNPPSRQPIGVTLYNTDVFVSDIVSNAVFPGAYHAYTNEVKVFNEDFGSYLSFGETAASYTIDSTSGITVSGDSLTDAVVTYTATFDEASELEEVIITMTSSTGQKVIHKKQFVIEDAN
jgi:hypothetical protein